MLVADTLRADRLGVYGSARGLTPFLDSLAARSSVFAHAYAPSSWTCPSVASLFTSRYPSQHRVSSFTSKMASDEATLAEALKAAGFVTAGFSANNRLTEKLGYAQGFDIWQFFVGAFVPPYRKAPVRAGFLSQRSLQWLDTGWDPANPQRVFLYLQFMDTHTPYDPPQAFRRRFQRTDPGGALEKSANDKLMQLALDSLEDREIEVLEALYDGEVAYLDAELERLFAELSRRGFLDDAVVVLTSDHGEEFREHGRILHGFSLYEESVRVPLLILVPGARGGRVIEQPVSLLDLAPTLLELLGIPSEPRFEGRSLVPLLFPPGPFRRGTSGGDDAAPPDVVLELRDKGEATDTRGHHLALVRGRTKLLVDPDGRRVVYDLDLDPGETSPSGDTDAAAALARALDRTRDELAQRAAPGIEQVPLAEDEKQRLRELGYGVD
jgi:arylsulfatase A-like enzyme